MLAVAVSFYFCTLIQLWVETINFSGLGFVGFYTSSHAYEILDRSGTNELKLKNYYAHENNAWFWTLTNRE